MTKSRFLLLLFVIVSKSIMGQQYTTTGDFDRISKATFGFGVNTYFGELSAFSTDTKVQLGLSTTLTYEHLFTDNIALRGGLSVYSIKGTDSLSVEKARVQRNLSFKATNIEFTAQALYYVFRHPYSGYKDRAFANPYFHLGLGITTNKPKATLAGTDYELRPMRLEGIEYGTLALIVPVGMGVNIFINRNIDLQVEMQYTAALTKYLDDVSANYRDPSSFADPVAAQLSDRRIELGLTPAAAGDARGQGTNDAYLRFGFRFGYYLPKSLYGKSSIRCKVAKKTR
ncbi:hypothetical protein [Roseivirga sp.]|uniref:hypothetical protein n=1 Tax=Roseivirga sp. TaxID=1964215 RepID=UPI002B267EA6|nr:hypothetical protein [Roseivirga sp.]